ncbi:MAG: patatin-like phospholipase family protein [Hyphomicrobiaceae bacterium]
MRLFRREQRLNLALQGGGVHGAFTWGVLDRLLNEEWLKVGWISGTSAGAVNAVAVAHGLAKGDARLGLAALADIWSSVERSGVPDLMRLNPFLMGLAKAAPVGNVAAFLSPYDFNPAGFDPLRKILEQSIDFEAIRNDSSIGLLIAATDVETGRARLFQRSELTVETVLASACLPTLHHAVQIDGRYYWDGGFSANPDLLTLVDESDVRDTLLVQLNPIRHIGLPKGTKSIDDRVNTITFNQPLLHQVETIVMAQKSESGWFGSRNDRVGRLRSHRFHLIAAGAHTAQLDSDSKMIPEKQLLSYLRQSGSEEADYWLMQHKTSIGRRSTVDFREGYFELESVRKDEDVSPSTDTTDVAAPRAAVR